MKILVNCGVPFCLAHGGLQIQVEQTMAALGKIGVEVEPLRWWDESQRGDILHDFGRMPPQLLRLAQQKGIKVAISALEGAPGARPAWFRLLQKAARLTLRAAAPQRIANYSWNAYSLADAVIALTPWEAHLLVDLFQADPAKVHTIPNGVESVFLESQPEPRGPWLVCTATIVEMKQVLKLAQMAVLTRTPIWFIGRPYSETDDYARNFREYARHNPEFVRYEGPILDRQRLARIYRQARGFVLLSLWESLSLSALEAVACGCPLLLSDLPWARWSFGDRATYCPAKRSVEIAAPILRAFYEQAPQLPVPPGPLSWVEVAKQLENLYASLCKTSR